MRAVVVSAVIAALVVAQREDDEVVACTHQLSVPSGPVTYTV